MARHEGAGRGRKLLEIERLRFDYELPGFEVPGVPQTGTHQQVEESSLSVLLTKSATCPVPVSFRP